jgi:hypothetical protein
MSLQTIMQQLETSAHPVVEALYKSDHCKVLLIVFKKGMILKDHKTQNKAKLSVLSGEVIYSEGDSVKTLSQFEETEIPSGVVHAVECTENAICLLVRESIT